MKYRIVLITLPVILSLVAYATIRIKTNELPDSSIHLAREMISEAELVKSASYAKDQYRQATEYYDSAMLFWSRENDRFILFRDYRKTIEMAEKSTESSGKAIASAKKNVSEVEELLQHRIEELGEKIKEFDVKFSDFPMNSSQRNDMAKSRLQYSEGVLAYKNKNYTICRSKLDSAETTINRVFEWYEERLLSYFDQYPKWSEMVEKTVLFSKRNRAYCIVVDKLARECRLYKDGKVISSYTVELGVNWMGDKNQQGDKSTPEGMYKITSKKSNGQTAFYKALMLDYPNDEDKRRFVENKKSGVIHQDANIGNLIEIHGSGGKGIDWTDGCIALKNEDLDKVYKMCPVGTWVTIVGSTSTLNELFL